MCFIKKISLMALVATATLTSITNPTLAEDIADGRVDVSCHLATIVNNSPLPYRMVYHATYNGHTVNRLNVDLASWEAAINTCRLQVRYACAISGFSPDVIAYGTGNILSYYFPNATAPCDSSLFTRP